jgi:flagellar biosynthesis chaperone FliJ
MDTILGMTDCDKKLFLLRCEDSCSGKSFVSFGQDTLHKAMTSLRSDGARQVLSDSLTEAYEDGNMTNFTTTWAPVTIPEMTVTRTGPCKEPVAEDKRTGKCSMNSNPNCDKMQEKFKYIQAGIEEKRDELQDELAKLRADCESTRMNLEAQISDFETKLKDAQTALAGATKKQNNAEGQSRLKNTELKALLADYARMTTTCHTNYETYEGEECGLKKIRGELYKMQGQDNPAFFQDCVVSEWLPGECSASCAGGVMKMTRTIVTHPVGGATCPLLVAQKPCNEHKCPIDCIVHDWQGWSGCSAHCGGGLMERTRDVMVEPMHGGEPCGETSEAISCNLQACDKDCELSDWGPWSKCSKACDQGVIERTKTIAEPAIGQGTCPAMLSEDRHQNQPCNMFPCQRAANQPTLRCESKADIILLIDGSGSLGQTGWDASVKAGAMLARAFGAGTHADVRLAVLLFSYYSKWVKHFTSDTEACAVAIEKLTWPRSLTFTANALNTASSELSLGRDDAQTTVILLTDGRPMYTHRTWWAAHNLRRNARLMTVPVTRWAPIDQAKQWASYPKEDNFLPLDSFQDLEDPDKLDLIIADVCPQVD